MDLDRVCIAKRNRGNAVLVIIEGNKASLGWKEAEAYSKATGCSIGTIRNPSDGERIKWVVRPKNELGRIRDYFKRLGCSVVFVDGQGKHISGGSLSNNNGRNNTSSPKKKEQKREQNATRQKRTKYAQDGTKKSSRTTPKTRSKRGVNVVTGGSIFDVETSGSYKKVNPVNTTTTTKDAGKRAAQVTETRSFVDSEIHPNGVRYGDAYRYRKKNKRGK